MGTKKPPHPLRGAGAGTFHNVRNLSLKIGFKRDHLGFEFRFPQWGHFQSFSLNSYLKEISPHHELSHLINVWVSHFFRSALVS